MKKRYKNALETRALYKFENEYFSGHILCKTKPIKSIRRMARRIMPNPPKIRVHKGIYYNGRYLSFQCKDGIFLTRNQCEYLTLAHELVHAMGYDYHDSKFVRKYFSILVKFFKLNKRDLIKAAKQYKVAL